MKRYLIIFILLSVVVSSSCRKHSSGAKEKIAPYTITEALDSIPLIVVTDSEIRILDAKSLKSLDSYKIRTKDLIRSFLFEERVYVVCKDVAYWIDLSNLELSKVNFPVKMERIEISGNHLIVSNNHSIFLLGKDGLLTKLKDFKREMLKVYVLSDISSIVALFHTDEKNELVRFSLTSKKFEKQIGLNDYVNMAISPFGKRIYVLTKHKLIFLNTKNLEIISEIAFKGTGKEFLITASENRIFIFTENPAKIVSIKRTTMEVSSEEILAVSPREQYITGDGGTIFFLAQDTLYRFDTGVGEVVKKGIATRGSNLLKATWKGLRVISSKKESSELSVFDGNTLLRVETITLTSNLLDVFLGREAVKKEIQVSLPVESLGVDTAKSKPENPAVELFTLQVSSSSVSEGARKLYANIRQLSVPVYIDSAENKGSERVYKVKIGAFNSRKDAESFKNGIKETYNVSSWVTKAVFKPGILKEVGTDINGDLNRELLLHYNKRLILFTNYGGILKSVLDKSTSGVVLKQKPLVQRQKDEIVIGIPFDGDSIFAVKWLNKKYEFVKRKYPS